MTKNTVIYSFNGRWEKPLREGKVRVFFRKRCPVSTPNRIAFYVGVPIKEIIGYANLERIDLVNLQGAIAMKHKGCISDSELLSYIGGTGEVHALHIGPPILLPRPLHLQNLSAEYDFNPPQSFSYPSQKLEEAIFRSAK